MTVKAFKCQGLASLGSFLDKNIEIICKNTEIEIKIVRNFSLKKCWDDWLTGEYQHDAIKMPPESVIAVATFGSTQIPISALKARQVKNGRKNAVPLGIAVVVITLATSHPQRIK